MCVEGPVYQGLHTQESLFRPPPSPFPSLPLSHMRARARARSLSLSLSISLSRSLALALAVYLSSSLPLYLSVLRLSHWLRHNVGVRRNRCTTGRSRTCSHELARCATRWESDVIRPEPPPPPPAPARGTSCALTNLLDARELDRSKCSSLSPSLSLSLSEQV
jgi:hypothetical protein